MKIKLFKNIYIVCMAVFVLTSVFIIGAVTHSISTTQINNLREQAAYFERLIIKNGQASLDDLQAGSSFRITIISPSGMVEYDSLMDEDSLPNHLDRNEIADAFEYGEGQSTRKSGSTQTHTSYYAKKMENGSVLRVAAEKYTVSGLLINLFTPLLVITVIAIAISVCIAYRLSRAVTEPINNIDLQTPDERDVYEEIKPLVRRINKQNRKIQQQMEAQKNEHKKREELRREFTANVSHELKTPLTSISGYAELIKNGIARPEDVPEFAGRICEESARLYALVEDILELSRLEESRDSKFEDVELSSICRETANRLQPQAQKKSVGFILNLQECTVKGIKTVIEEIVYNLCDNAVKYNKEGGKVEITLNNYILKVKDTGIGIAQNELERVFERFYRVDKSHSKEIGGTGLGLSIVKHGAGAHNARVEISSLVNVGTEVTVIFKENRQ